MESFSIEKLKARHAILSGAPGRVSITILMRPFLRNGAIVDADIDLERVDLPSSALADLAGKTFAFPINPDEGYIDGSIHLDSAHHPVDVTSMSFARSRDGTLTLIAKGVYRFDIEGLDNLGATAFTLAATVSSCTV